MANVVYNNVFGSGVDFPDHLGQFSNVADLPTADDYEVGVAAYVIGEDTAAERGFYEIEESGGVKSWVSMDVGGGDADMEKATYDTNDDGTVDSADSAASLDDGTRSATALQVDAHLNSTNNPHNTAMSTLTDAGSSLAGLGASDGHSSARWSGSASEWVLRKNSVYATSTDSVTDSLDTDDGYDHLSLHVAETDSGTAEALAVPWVCSDPSTGAAVWRMASHDAPIYGGGRQDVSGDVTLPVQHGRAFRSQMTGNITSLTLTSVTASTTGYTNLYAYNEVAFRWYLDVDATGNYTFADGGLSITWLDGSSFDDLDLTPNATNIIQFLYVGGSLYAWLIWNGSVRLSDLDFSFSGDDTQLKTFDRDYSVDLGNAIHRAQDGTAGDGSLSYEKNGTSASGLTTFAANDVLAVIRSGSSNPAAVSIPWYLA